MNECENKQKPIGLTSDSAGALAPIAQQLYHQINFLHDIQASASAVDDCLELNDDDSLDKTFIDIANVANQVVTGCRQTLDSCQLTKNNLDESQVSLGEVGISLEQLLEANDGIAQIAKMIENFSRQTSMLSFNARIVAAHASGEEGMGFEVIAAEVGRLAQSIRAESDSIRGTLDTVSDCTSQVVQRVQSEIDRNQEHAAIVDEMVNTSEGLLQCGNQLTHTVQQLDRAKRSSTN